MYIYLSYITPCTIFAPYKLLIKRTSKIKQFAFFFKLNHTIMKILHMHTTHMSKIQKIIRQSMFGKDKDINSTRTNIRS